MIVFLSRFFPQQLTIFNNRQKVSKATVSGAQSSSLIYNGFGGSERKENFVGFPNGLSKSNTAGRMLSLSSSKNGLTKKWADDECSFVVEVTLGALNE